MLPILGSIFLGFVTAQLAFMVTTVYLHRCLAHRALKLAPGVLFACRVIIWIATGTRPRQWVAVHRKHHAFTDTDRDPHSPLVLGFARVQFANAIIYRKVARDPATIAKYARDLPEDRWDRVLFNHAVLGLALGIGFLVVLLGWKLAIIASVVHASLYLLGGGAINAIGHRFGSRPYDNKATNNQWLAWVVVGEGLHNNHHAATTSSRMSLNPGEFDPGWWCIRLLVAMHLATLRTTSRDVATIPEVGTAADDPAASGDQDRTLASQEI